MKSYLQKNNSDNLILLLNGWGMDERPLLPLKSTYDVLQIFDYNELNNDVFDFDFSAYKSITLMCFSAGVYMAGILKNVLPKCDLKIAINGSLNTLDEKEGLPLESAHIIENVNDENYMELRKRLISKKEHIEMFNQNQPYRNVESCLAEFESLKKYYAEYKKIKFNFDKAIIAKDDRLMPMENQIKSWNEYKNTRQVFSSGGHFLFYNFSDFDEIISL